MWARNEVKGRLSFTKVIRNIIESFVYSNTGTWCTSTPYVSVATSVVSPSIFVTYICIHTSYSYMMYNVHVIHTFAWMIVQYWLLVFFVPPINIRSCLICHTIPDWMEKLLGWIDQLGGGMVISTRSTLEYFLKSFIEVMFVRLDPAHWTTTAVTVYWDIQYDAVHEVVVDTSNEHDTANSQLWKRSKSCLMGGRELTDISGDGRESMWDVVVWT